MLLDIEKGQSRFNENDIIVFSNGKWTTIHKGEFLGSVCQLMNNKESNLKKENEELRTENKRLENEIVQTNAHFEQKIAETNAHFEQKIAEMNAHFEQFKAAVNEKLKEHHNVLNALTGVKK